MEVVARDAGERAQLAAARGYVESLREYWLAQVELERAMGVRLEQANAPSSPPPAKAPNNGPSEKDQAHHHQHKQHRP